jgi:hypothetical protein
MVKGDIVVGEGNKNQNYPVNGHPIVFLQENSGSTFIGLMLSSSTFRGLNTKMDESHFELFDGDGLEYEFKYKNTHVVPLRLLKKDEWKPFTKIGQLSEEGIVFVEEVIKGTKPIFWEEAVEMSRVSAK